MDMRKQIMENSMGNLTHIFTFVYVYSFNDTDKTAIPERRESMFILIPIVFLKDLVGYIGTMQIITASNDRVIRNH